MKWEDYKNYPALSRLAKGRKSSWHGNPAMPVVTRMTRLGQKKSPAARDSQRGEGGAMAAGVCAAAPLLLFDHIEPLAGLLHARRA